MKPPHVSPVNCGTPSLPDTFSLTDFNVRPDLQNHASRSDFVDVVADGGALSSSYEKATEFQCIAGAVMIHDAPHNQSIAVSQLLHGEGFAVLDHSGSWAWGHSLHDGYTGYVGADSLGPATRPTHRVTTPLALIFAEPDIKAPVTGHLTMGAQVSGSETAPFIRLAKGYVHHRHLAPTATVETDWTTVAERLIGAPYLWGGRGGGGIDCSGLVQIALQMTGHLCPRDSDQQREALGIALPPDVPPMRGDLVFFPGHVGIMVDGWRLLHANAWWMAVVTEPLASVIERIVTQHPQPVLARKRIKP